MGATQATVNGGAPHTFVVTVTINQLSAALSFATAL